MTRVASRTIGGVFAVSLAYAVVRYIVFKGVPIAHLPLYVVNKAVSMTALFLLGLSAIAASSETRRNSRMAGFGASGLHVLLSLAILSPSYYPKLFLTADGSSGFNLSGELVTLSGALGFWTLLLVAWPRNTKTSPGWIAALPWLVRCALLLVALHCLLRGWSGWWNPGGWPGYLPPITLLSFLYAAGTVALSFGKPGSQG